MGLAADCSASPARGYEKTAILINRADINFGTLAYSTSHKNTLTTLGLLSGKQGYKVEQRGATPFTGTAGSVEVGTYGTTVTHTIPIAVIVNDRELAEKFEDGLLNGDFVMILECKDKGPNGDSAFKVFGIQNGLQLSDYAEDAYGDTFGGALFTLQETGASRTSVYLGESYSAGKAIWDSLLSSAS